MTVSVIVPVLGEGQEINALLGHLRHIAQGAPYEVIVVDGAPEGSTIRWIEDPEVKTLVASPGRASQMNAGAALARGQALLFLHADTRLPPRAFELIAKALREQPAGAFSLELESPSPMVRFIAFTARLRVALGGAPYGDQALFLRRDFFFRLGGYPEIPLMEDVALVKLIRRSGAGMKVLAQRVRSSARRYHTQGVLRTTFKNKLIRALYALGVSPQRLWRLYYGRR